MSANTVQSGKPPRGARRSAVAAAEPAAPPRPPAAVQLRARRSPRLIVIGVLCACLGALGMAWAWQATQFSQQVVLVAADVARGERIEATDLTTTTIGAAPGVATVPADQLDTLIGQYAQVDLSAGGLVGPASFGPEVLPLGTSQVGLRLAAGRLPSQALPPGSQVVLVAVPNQLAGQQDEFVEELFEAVVVSTPTALPDGQTWLVDVQVASEDAPRVAALAASEQIALVRKGVG